MYYVILGVGESATHYSLWGRVLGCALFWCRMPVFLCLFWFFFYYWDIYVHDFSYWTTHLCSLKWVNNFLLPGIFFENIALTLCYHKTLLCQIFYRDILHESSRLHDTVSLWCLVPWITGPWPAEPPDQKLNYFFRGFFKHPGTINTTCLPFLRSKWRF